MADTTQSLFARRLKEARLRKGWSQEQVAERVSTTRQNVSRWERGLTIPGPYFRQQLSVAFERSVEELGLLSLPTGASAAVLHPAEEAHPAPTLERQHHPAPDSDSDSDSVSTSASASTGGSAPSTPQATRSDSAPTSSSSPPLNLPVPPSPLIGRGAEVAVACELLRQPDVRLLTLCGSPGVGKTRLGLAVAAEVLLHFPDGVFFVSLAPLRDPSLVAHAIAQAVGLLDQSAQPPAEALITSLRDKQVLLLLDNFEHLAPAAPLVADLLARCPSVKVLATSRAALHVRGEHESPVPPLALPDPDDLLPPVEALAQIPAVALFVGRARGVTPDFALTAANAANVTAICQRLDGLPLAIELAAARIRLLPPEALLARLERRLPLLTSGPPDLPERQQTLRATLAWSYDLLLPPERTVFRRLAVCVGGCTLAAAEAICPAAEAGTTTLACDVLDSLSALLDHHLLFRSREPAGTASDGSESRVSMLETVREFGLEQLAASGELHATQQAHAAYYLAFAEQASAYFKGAEQSKWLTLVEQEHANLRAALTWAVEGEGAETETETALRLAAALVGFWRMHGHVSEGRNCLERVLELIPVSAEVDPRLARARAKVINGLGLFAYRQGDLAQATVYFEQSLELWRHLGDSSAAATLLNNLGIVAKLQDDFALAERRYAQSLALHRQLQFVAEDVRGISMVLSNLAEVLRIQGQYDQARQLCEESLALRRKTGEGWGIAIALCNLGDIARETGDADRAAALYEESRVLLSQMGDPPDLVETLIGMAHLAYNQGDLPRAVDLCEKCLDVARRVSDQQGIAAALIVQGNVAHAQGEEARALTLYRDSLDRYRTVESQRGIVGVLEAVAIVRCAQGHPSHAARLLGATSAFRDTMGAPVPPVDRPLLDHTRAACSVALGDAQFAALWTEGTAMTLERAGTQAAAATIEEKEETLLELATRAAKTL